MCQVSFAWTLVKKDSQICSQKVLSLLHFSKLFMWLRVRKWCSRIKISWRRCLRWRLRSKCVVERNIIRRRKWINFKNNSLLQCFNVRRKIEDSAIKETDLLMVQLWSIETDIDTPFELFGTGATATDGKGVSTVGGSKYSSYLWSTKLFKSLLVGST